MRLFALMFALFIVGGAPLLADIVDDDEAPAKPITPAIEPNKPAGSSGETLDSSPSKVKKGGKAASLPKDEAEKPASAPSSGAVLAPKGGAKKKAPSEKSDGQQPVEFQTDGLNGLREKGYVELEKNVVVTQGSMRLEADHAQAYYDEVTRELIKVVCDGNVKMFKTDEDSGEKIKALGDSAVFMNKERKVTVEGNARLWRGNDLVRGKKIVYEMDSGWIRADRVAGEVHPTDKDAKP